MLRVVSVIAFAVLFIGLERTAAQTPKAKPKSTNRLSRETSPYLLMHAHNPTDWHAWGPEAFEKAKKENKLVFLSIGYSSCYWCHVMERESFNNEACAKVLNESFICIKVDREERPDIDHIYMTALHALRSGGGGWPLSMFLLPDGRPVVGGTYWPREDKVLDGEKSLGFMSLLRIVRDHWKEDPKAIEKQAEKLAEGTVQALSTGPGIAIVSLDRKFVDGIVDELKDEFDPEYGGFGNPNRKFRGPKFPTPPRLELVLQAAQRTKNKELLNMVTLTLDKMAHGGIWDHLGGGFHRYTVERTWTVPHFEKMLYDNAQLTEVYSKAYAATKNPLYRKVVEDTLAYVRREMMSPEGAFYSSQDAETHHEEGRFYVWTPEELAAALPDKADRDFVRKVYGLDKVNFEEKYHILTLPKPLAETAKDLKLTEEQLNARLNPLKEKLLVERGKRDKPFRNEIALTAWSGQMIAGFAEAGRSLKDQQHLDVARKAADFVLKHQVTKEGRLLRTYGAAPGQQPKAAVNGYLDDYAFLVHGLLTLHEATGEAKWLETSKKLTDVMIQFHGDKKGGFYMTASDHEKLFARAKDQYDGAQPSGNSTAARNLSRLWKLTGEEKWRDEAQRTFKVFAGGMKLNGSGLAAMVQALDGWLDVQEASKPKQQPKTSEKPQGVSIPLRNGSAANAILMAPLSLASSVMRNTERYASQFPVTIHAEAGKPDAEGNQSGVVTLHTKDGYQVYAVPVGNEDLKALQLRFRLSADMPLLKESLRYPPGRKRQAGPDVYHVWEGQVRIHFSVRRTPGDASPLVVDVVGVLPHDATGCLWAPVRLQVAIG